MPPAYTARRPDMYDNVGSYAPEAPQVDVGGAIDAVSNGALSLIHGAMLRRQAENTMALERQRLATQAQAQKFQQDRMLAEDKYRGEQQQNERQKIDDAFLLAGGIRGTKPAPTMVPEATTERVGPLPTPASPRGPIARSMAPKAAGGLPPLAETPTAPPTPAASNPLPANTKLRQSMTAGTQDRVEPTTAAKFVQSTSLEDLRQRGRVTLADIRNANTQDRDAVLQMYKQQNINYAGHIRDVVGAHLAGMKAAAGSNKPMTVAQRVAAQRFVFDQIGKQANGSPDEAASILSSDGALSDLAKSVGITEAEVRRATAAFGTKANEASDKQVLGVFQSGMAKDIPAAKAAVDAAKTPPVKPGIKAATPAPTAGTPAPKAKPDSTTTPAAVTAPAAVDAAKLPPLSAAAKERAMNGKGGDKKDRDAFRAFLAEKGYTEGHWNPGPVGATRTSTDRIKLRRPPADSGKK